MLYYANYSSDYTKIKCRVVSGNSSANYKLSQAILARFYSPKYIAPFASRSSHFLSQPSNSLWSFCVLDLSLLPAFFEDYEATSPYVLHFSQTVRVWQEWYKVKASWSLHNSGDWKHRCGMLKRPRKRNRKATYGNIWIWLIWLICITWHFDTFWLSRHHQVQKRRPVSNGCGLQTQSLSFLQRGAANANAGRTSRPARWRACPDGAPSLWHTAYTLYGYDCAVWKDWKSYVQLICSHIVVRCRLAERTSSFKNSNCSCSSRSGTVRVTLTWNINQYKRHYYGWTLAFSRQ